MDRAKPGDPRWMRLQEAPVRTGSATRNLTDLTERNPRVPPLAPRDGATQGVAVAGIAATDGRGLKPLDRRTDLPRKRQGLADLPRQSACRSAPGNRGAGHRHAEMMRLLPHRRAQTAHRPSGFGHIGVVRSTSGQHPSGIRVITALIRLPMTRGAPLRPLPRVSHRRYRARPLHNPRRCQSRSRCRR